MRTPPARSAPPALSLLMLAVLQTPVNAAAQGSSVPEAQVIVVSATRHAMAMVDAPAAMSVVPGQRIDDRGADNVLDALRGETGITLFGRTISGRKSLAVRGLDGRHTLMLVDGKRISPSDGVVGHSDFQGDWIPSEDIERLELIRGPMSVLYGAEALGGVVNTITRPLAEAWTASALLEGSLAAGGRGGDGHRGALRVSGALGAQFRMAATAADTRRQIIYSQTDPRISEIEGRHRTDGALQGAWLAATGQRVDAELRVGQEQRHGVSRETRGLKRYYDSITDIERRHTALAWTADWGGALELRSLLRAYESVLDARNTRNNGVASLRPNRLADRVLEGQGSLHATRSQLLTGGFELRDEQLDNEALPGGRGDAAHRALYLQDEWAPARELALTAGLRWDHHSAYGNEWSPRAYAVWKPAPRWVVKGGVGHGFKAPTVKQVTPGYKEDEGPNTFHSNPALRPETNDAIEIGVGWDTPQAGAQLMLFHNRVDELVVSKLTGVVAGRQQYTFVNLDRARLQGVELSGTLVLGAGFGAALNYQYLDATDGNGQRLEKRPRNALGARLDWEGGPWRAGLDLTYAGGQLLASTVANQPPQPVPGITLVGAYAAWRLTRALELSAGVSNLGDVNLAQESPLFTYAEAPRTWRLGLRGRW